MVALFIHYDEHSSFTHNRLENEERSEIDYVYFHFKITGTLIGQQTPFENGRQKCILCSSTNINTIQTRIHKRESHFLWQNMIPKNLTMCCCQILLDWWWTTTIMKWCYRFQNPNYRRRDQQQQTYANDSLSGWEMEQLKIRLLCPVCEKRFSNKGNLSAHKKKFHGSELAITYPCVKCDKLFEYKRNWKQHYINKHSKLRIALKVAERRLKQKTTANKCKYTLHERFLMTKCSISSN